MAYLIKVGLEKKNISNHTSKGYHIYRRSCKIYIRFGAVDVSGLSKQPFTWHKNVCFSRKPLIFTNTIRAKEYLQKILTQKEKKGYEKLSIGIKINFQ